MIDLIACTIMATAALMLGFAVINHITTAVEDLERSNRTLMSRLEVVESSLEKLIDALMKDAVHEST